MNINGITQVNAVNSYKTNKKVVSKSSETKVHDSVEISTEARNLNSMTNDISGQSSPERLESIKNQISKGTYKPDAKLIAQKMVSLLKGREV
jgi:negative regulator of flagellin synthesis FlgM